MAFTKTHTSTTNVGSVAASTWGGTGWFEPMDASTCVLKLASGSTAPTSINVRLLATNTASGNPPTSDIFEVVRFVVTPAAANQSTDFPVTMARGAYGDHRRYAIEAQPIGQAITLSYILSRSELV